jgi:hypothetical protein
MIMNIRKNWYWVAPVGIAAMALFAFLGGEIVKLLWNWLVPALFGWREITFWQGLGLLALCRVLFGGHGFMGSGRSKMRHRLSERWERMTPEEQEKLRSRMSGRCGPFGGETAEPKA